MPKKRWIGDVIKNPNIPVGGERPIHSDEKYGGGGFDVIRHRPYLVKSKKDKEDVEIARAQIGLQPIFKETRDNIERRDAMKLYGLETPEETMKKNVAFYYNRKDASKNDSRIEELINKKVKERNHNLSANYPYKKMDKKTELDFINRLRRTYYEHRDLFEQELKQQKGRELLWGKASLYGE